MPIMQCTLCKNTNEKRKCTQLPVLSNNIPQIHGAAVHIIPSLFPPKRPNLVHVHHIILSVYRPDWRSSAFRLLLYNHVRLTGSSQETGKAISQGLG